MAKNLRPVGRLGKAFWAIFPKLNGQTYRRNTFKNVFTDLKTNAESNRLPRLSKQTLGKLNHFSVDTLNSKLKKEYKADADALEIIQLQALANLGRDLQAMESAEEAVFICLQLDLLSYINQSIAEQKNHAASACLTICCWMSISIDHQ